MSQNYTPTKWEDNRTVGTASVMNNMEKGIEDAHDRIDGVDSQIKENMNKISKFHKIIRYTDGYGDNGGVFGVMANVDDNRALEICNYPNAAYTSTYTDRDSVAVYIHNEGCNPTIDTSNGIYGTNYVDVDLCVDLSKVKEGMIIDTKHSPGFSSIIDSIEGNRIYVRDGWFEKVKGGSTTPSIPLDGTGFSINKTTKIWGINNNVFLNDSTVTKHAVSCEFGLFGSKTDNNNNSIAGVDLINFGSMAPRFGFSVRKAKPTARNFITGYLAEHTNNAFVYKTGENPSYLLRSVENPFLLQHDQLNNYFLTSDGVQSKIRGITSSITDSEVFSDDSTTSFYYINLTSQANKTFLDPSKIGSGVIKFVKNIGSAVNLVTPAKSSFFHKEKVGQNVLRLEQGDSATLITDGANWFVIGFERVTNKGCVMINNLSSNLSTDKNAVIFNINGGGTYTIPNASEYRSGEMLLLKNINDTSLSIKSNVFIDDVGKTTMLLTKGQSIKLFTDGASWIVF